MKNWMLTILTLSFLALGMNAMAQTDHSDNNPIGAVGAKATCPEGVCDKHLEHTESLGMARIQTTPGASLETMLPDDYVPAHGSPATGTDGTN